MQPNGDPRVRIFNGYSHILWRYAEARALRQVDGALMLWYEKEIGNLESHMVDLGMSSSRTSTIISSLVAMRIQFHLYVPVRTVTRLAAS